MVNKKKSHTIEAKMLALDLDWIWGLDDVKQSLIS
jgi:hypothetical protein